MPEVQGMQAGFMSTNNPLAWGEGLVKDRGDPWDIALSKNSRPRFLDDQAWSLDNVLGDLGAIYQDDSGSGIEEDWSIFGELGELEGIFDSFKKPKSFVQGQVKKSALDKVLPTKPIAIVLGLGVGLLLGVIVGRKF